MRFAGTAEEHRKVLESRFSDLSKRVGELKEKIARTLLFEKAFRGIFSSWREDDPGKHSDAFFFLDGAGERVIVEELLKGEDPRGFKAVPIKDLINGDCPSCGAKHPVIGRYFQEVDAPEGDRWKLEHLLLCPSSFSAFTIKALTRTSDRRF